MAFYPKDNEAGFIKRPESVRNEATVALAERLPQALKAALADAPEQKQAAQGGRTPSLSAGSSAFHRGASPGTNCPV